MSFSGDVVRSVLLRLVLLIGGAAVALFLGAAAASAHDGPDSTPGLGSQLTGVVHHATREARDAATRATERAPTRTVHRTLDRAVGHLQKPDVVRKVTQVVEPATAPLAKATDGVLRRSADGVAPGPVSLPPRHAALRAPTPDGAASVRALATTTPEVSMEPAPEPATRADRMT